MNTAMLTEKWLLETGGWREMKTARELLRAGKVRDATYDPPTFRALVRDGPVEYRAGLRILGRTEAENLCGCPTARRDGTVCAHSLAAGLACLAPAPAAPGPAKAEAPRPSPWPEVRLADSEPDFRLAVVLPADPGTATAKGRLQAVFEAVSATGKRPLDRQLREGVWTLAEEDARLIAVLKKLSPDTVAPMVICVGEDLGHLLAGLDGHPRVTAGRAKALRIGPSRQRLTLRAREGRWKVELPHGVIRFAGRAWLWEEDGFGELAAGLPGKYRSILTEGWTPQPDEAKRAWDQLVGWFELPDWEAVAKDLPAPVRPRVKIALEGDLNRLDARIAFLYPGVEIEAGDGRVWRGIGSDGQVLVRDLGFEGETLSEIGLAGFEPIKSGRTSLRGMRAVVGFVARRLEEWKGRYEVTFGGRLTAAMRRTEIVRPQLRVTGGGSDWFSAELAVDSRTCHQINASELDRMLRGGVSKVRQGSRELVMDEEALDELKEVLRDAGPEQKRPGVYQIPAIQREFVASYERDPSYKQITSHLEISREINAFLSSDKVVKLLNLRDYQRDGLMWMAERVRAGLGGVLADDMGLGKTVQAAMLMGWNGGLNLVICPSSLLAHWERELMTCLSNTRCHVISGPDRDALFASVPKEGVLLTSYALFRRDAERYRCLPLDLVILDEAQHIKNPETQNARLARDLPSRSRIVLTGTPVENSVRDLWSIFEFVLPGYLGPYPEFRERYEEPIRQGDPKALLRLKRRIAPYLLRRRKEEVAPELPPRVEQTLACDLAGYQAELYLAILRRGREELAAATGGRQRMAALTALLRLRQVCCDPRLLDVEPPEGETSAKVALFEETVQELLDSGRRALVFSQFVSMLTLLRGWLDARGIGYCYLDGATEDRAGAVDRFQNDPAIPLFLISLKAGGTGLNLTAADTVILFDPWWNPAVEAQAGDRAHRIGQDKTVHIIRLLARGTVEEKIQALQRGKRAAFEDLIGGGAGAGLTTEEMAGLLE